jgi:hypothetical protein
MGQPVQVISDHSAIANRQYRGAVTGSTSPKGWYESMSNINFSSKTQEYKNSLNDLRNKTALLGADTVLIVSRESMFEQAVITGRAFDCI